MGRDDGRVWAVTLIRGVLFAAVLGGLLGMHVLTADHDRGGHGPLPTPIGAHASTAGPEAGAAATAMADRFDGAVTVHAGPSPDGSGWVTGIAACVLFLAFGAAALALALSRCRTGGRPAEPASWLRMALLSLRRRGPPHPPPRSTLCVIRV